MHKFEILFNHQDEELNKRFKDVYLYSTYDGEFYVGVHTYFRTKFINNIWDHNTLNIVRYEIEVESPEDEIIFRLKMGV